MKRYALLGPPNVGKSTLFYTLTGVYVKTGNYPGRDAKATEIYEGANEVVLNTLFKLAEKYEA
jgi:Fe2+ transport system protein B